MHISSTHCVYFSPTGTTKAIMHSIVAGCGDQIKDTCTFTDLTPHTARGLTLSFSREQLLFLGVPVYAGRLPALVSQWLGSMQLAQTAVVAVVVYGNREFEDALLELQDLVQAQGGRLLAGAAFIGEHSFSSAQTPIALARPDAQDLAQGKQFGRNVAEKLTSLKALEEGRVTVPGTYPYRQAGPFPQAAFSTNTELCIQCGQCVEVCPVGAIRLANGPQTHTGHCILCCACIKFCPEQARSLQPGPVHDIALRLSSQCSHRKEPQCFL